MGATGDWLNQGPAVAVVLQSDKWYIHIVFYLAHIYRKKKLMERQAYLEQLIAVQGNQTVKVVTGIRRSGKSYLLNVLYRDYLRGCGVPDSHVIQVALDLTEFAELRDPRKLQRYVESKIIDQDLHYIFIDEIQMAFRVKISEVEESQVAPEDRESLYLTFYDVLNSLNARPNVDVYVTGSNSKMLSEDIATNFRGRRTEIAMHPLSFAEYFKARPQDKLDAWNEYMTFGGLPQVVLAPNDRAKMAVLDELLTKTYLKDVVDRHHIVDVGLLDNVVNVLASCVGSLTNPTKLVNTLKSQDKSSPSIPTFRKFLDYLTASYLFRKAERYDVRGRRYLDYPAKYYMEDVGLRNARLGFREQEETHLMENVIYNELIWRGYKVDVGVVEIRSHKEAKFESRQHEIDFVVNTGKEKIYIQSAVGMNDPVQRARETLPLLRTGDSFRKLVVTNGNQKRWVDDDGISHVGILSFLLDPSLDGFF